MHARHVNLSVIVFIIHGISVFLNKRESDPPVPADRNSPSPLSVALERVEVQSRKGHISWVGGSAQTTQYQTQPLSMLCADARFGAGLKELSETLVLEPTDHRMNCNPRRYRLQVAADVLRAISRVSS